MNVLITQAIVITGIISVLCQTLLMRELVAAFYGNELTIGFMVASWLLWGAIGSMISTRVLRPKLKSIKLDYYAVLQGAAAIVLPAEFFLIRSVKVLLSIPPGEICDPLTILSAALLILAPFALINGAQFIIGVRIFSERSNDSRESLARVYGLDAIADMFGAFLFAYFFIYYATAAQTIWISSTVHLLSVSILLARTRNIRLCAMSTILACFFVITYFVVPVKALDLKSKKWEWRGFEMVAAGSSPYGNISIIKYGSIYNLYENGLLSFSMPAKVQAEELVHLSMVQSPAAHRILLIGGAVAGSLVEVLKYPVEEVYYVELDPLIIELSKPYLTQEDRVALEDPRVKTVGRDGRLFVRKWRGKKFDAVIVNVGDPLTAFTNRFYTVEFFRELRQIVSDSGIIRIAVSSKEAYLSRIVQRYNGSVYLTLRMVLPNIIIIPGDQLTMLASPSSRYLTLEPGEIARRLNRLGITREYINEFYLAGILQPNEIEYVRTTLENLKGIRINRDFSPITYYYGLSYWATYFQPVVRKILLGLGNVRFFWILIITMVIFLLGLSTRNHEKYFLTICTGVMGFSGMAGVIIAVVSFQVLYGYVYHRVGLLTAAFMLGLFLGTVRAVKRLRQNKSNRKAYLACIVLTCLYFLVMPLVLHFFNRHGISILWQTAFPVFTLGIGVVIGFAFPLANSIRDKITGCSTPILYSADLLGGCLGGLVISIVLIPISGIILTCYTLALMNLIALVFFGVGSVLATNELK